jgi:hypothetical protein
MNNFRMDSDNEFRPLSDSELNLVSGGGAISQMMDAAKCIAVAVQVVSHLQDITPCIPCGDVRI